MTLSKHLFEYCERGHDPSFWAEPVNALSNLAFIIAALWALYLLRRQPDHQRNADHYLLIPLVFIIGIGSFLFHTFANVWSSTADVAPIGLFMLIYFGFALNRFMGLPTGWTVLLVIVFSGLIGAAMQVKCYQGAVGFLDVPVGKDGACLNGSVGYLPALAAMLFIGLYLRLKRHGAGWPVLLAGVVFAVSVTLRSLDRAYCEMLAVAEHPFGTHLFWHLLNALTLFLLLKAAILHGNRAGGPRQEQQIIPPRHDFPR